MKQTPNYNLPQFEVGDKFNKETLNEGYSKIDLAISDLQETFNANATGSALTTQEVVEARKGKETLKEKINEIEADVMSNKTQMDNKASLKDLVYVTPQMFGAKGDGITDDTVAIQNCFNNAKYVKIPFGTYIISDTITINKGLYDGIVIVGYANEVVGQCNFDINRMVMFKSLTPMLKPMFKIENTRNSRFENFTIDGGGTSSVNVIDKEGICDYCCIINNSPYNKWQNVNFKGAKKSAMIIQGKTYTNSFTNCAFSASVEYGFDSSQATDHCTQWFYNCRFDGNGLANMRLTGRLHCFIGCAFEGCVGNGLEIGFTGVDTYSNSFYACDIEGNVGNALKFNTPTNNFMFDGGQIIGNKGGTDDLIKCEFSLDNVFIKTNISTSLITGKVYNPTSQIWIRGHLCDEILDCIKSDRVFYSKLGEKKRDSYKEKIFTNDEISVPLNTLNGVGGVITNDRGFKINLSGNKVVSSLSGRVSVTDIPIKLKYNRCYNGGDKTPVVINVPINSDGTFTVNSSSGLWGGMDELYLFIIYDQNATTSRRIEVTELKSLLR